MSTQYLIDPWLVDLQPDDPAKDRFSRLCALDKIQEFQQKYGITPVEFVDEEFFNKFQSDHYNYQRPDGRALCLIVKNLVSTEQHQGQVAIVDNDPTPENLSDLWLQALDLQGSTMDPPNWRKPIIVIPEIRKALWPESSVIKYVTSDGKAMKRNLVCAEFYEQHEYFEPDLDPWRIGAIGMLKQIAGEPVAERNANRCRLPRPLHYLPLNLSFDELVEKLSRSMHWACELEGRAYFIPEKTWRPQTIGEDVWRKGVRAFPTKRLPNGRRGAVDRERRVWLWDRAENHHWDVQEAEGGHVNVSPDGRIL